MRFKHTNRKGFWLGFIDFFTAGLFFLVYMQRGLQDELDAGKREAAEGRELCDQIDSLQQVLVHVCLIGRFIIVI